MKKIKKEKTPPTIEELKSNDPLWVKVFNLRLNNQNEEADILKREILEKYK